MSPRPITTALRRIRGRRAEPELEAPRAADLGSLDPVDRRIVERAFPHTMTGVPRLQALIDATRYVVRRDISGALAECGAWRGGSVLAIILTLQELGVTDRDIHVYDTFEGMTEPTERDVSDRDGSAVETWARAAEVGERPWSDVFGADRFDEESVRRVLLSTGYPEERLHLVRGPVEDTLPACSPERLALLRLDTDWYESTRHELVHLYPRLAEGGVLLIDDYGHWQGCRQAVDEYFSGEAAPVLLCRTDYTGRLAVKH